MTEEHLLNAKCLISRYGSKISVQNQNTNLGTEARIKFGKLPETPAKAISLQNLHISGHIETINISRGYVTFSQSEFSVSPVSIELPNKLNMMFIRYSRFPLFLLTAEEQILLYPAFQN